MGYFENKYYLRIYGSFDVFLLLTMKMRIFLHMNSIICDYILHRNFSESYYIYSVELVTSKFTFIIEELNGVLQRRKRVIWFIIANCLTSFTYWANSNSPYIFQEVWICLKICCRKLWVVSFGSWRCVMKKFFSGILFKV